MAAPIPIAPTSICHYFRMIKEDEQHARSDPPLLSGTIDGRAYGGLLVSQAAKAFTTLYPDLTPHTVNYKYITVANSNIPLRFKIDRFEDFKIATIRAYQNGKTVGMGHVRYSHNIDPLHSSLIIAPDYGSPTDHPCVQEAASIRPSVGVFCHFPIDARVVLETDKIGRSAMWLRISPDYQEDIQSTDGLSVVLFHSDSTMFFGALDMYEAAKIEVGVLSSLHHSVWIHEYDLDPLAWYLSVTDCEVLSNGRALQYSHIFTECGKCVMTVTQEGYLQRVPVGKL